MRKLSGGALRGLDGWASRPERFGDGCDRSPGFDGGGTGHVGYQHLPVLLRDTKVGVGLDKRFLLHGCIIATLCDRSTVLMLVVNIGDEP